MRAAAILLVMALPVAVRAEAPAPVPPARPSAPASAPSTPVRTGEHPGFGRVVFDLSAGSTWTMDRTDDRLFVRVTGVDLLAGARPPHNVRALTASGGTAELTLAPGAQVRQSRLGNMLVIDVLDPVNETTADPAARPAAPAAKPFSVATAPSPAAPPAFMPSTPGPTGPAFVPPATTPPPAAVPSASRGAGAPAQSSRTGPPESGAVPSATPLAATPAAGTAPAAPPPAAPASISATPLALVASPATSAAAMLLPFAATTAAAAFRRGDEAVLVFDERRPVDTEALRSDRVFGTAEVHLLPTATVLRLRLPAGRSLHLARNPAGWVVTAGDDQAVQPIRPAVDETAGGARLLLPAPQPGHSVAVPDPLTGGTLLVGTQRQPGQGIVVPRHTPEFTLLPTWQGIAVAVISDALALRETTDGFVLGSALPRGGLALARPDADLAVLDDAQRLTRRFDFPALPVAALLRRLQGEVAGTGAAPAGVRTAPRLATAQAMLALGLGAEAQAVLSLAAANDPRAADDPDLIGLSAIAALLAGRRDETAGLDDSRLTGTDEVALWRGLRGAMLREAAPDAAAVLAAELPLLLAYPAPLQSHLLPLAAETMALGGEAAAARRLVDARPNDAGLDFARAVLAEQQDRPAALERLDRLAQSADRRMRARAAPRAVELRLAGGELTPAAAADAMEKLLFVWRGDGQEVALRLRTAELRAQSGAPRAALAVLREAIEAMPETRDQLHPRMEQMFAAALAADAATPMPPLELVELAGENPDLIAEGEQGLDLARRLAERLAALDLPRRALPVLEKLVAAAPPGVVRAELGGRLAGNRLLLGDAAGALSALGATSTDSMPSQVLEGRVLTWARATAAQGDPARAAAGLEALDSPAAMELRGQLLEQAKDWRGASAALRRYADRTLPAEGMLTEANGATLLRLAAAASQAGDEPTLARLRGQDLARLPPGRTADMLRLLTATPVQSIDDLPRARREAALAGALLGPAGR